MKTKGIINYGFQIHSSSPSSASTKSSATNGRRPLCSSLRPNLEGLSMGRLFFMIVASANASGSLRRKQFFVVVFMTGGGAGCPVHWRMHRPDSYAFRSVDGDDVTETLHIGLLPTMRQQQPRPRSAEGRGREV